jgi:hypothetical protein
MLESLTTWGATKKKTFVVAAKQDVPLLTTALEILFANPEKHSKAYLGAFMKEGLWTWQEKEFVLKTEQIRNFSIARTTNARYAEGAVTAMKIALKTLDARNVMDLKMCPAVLGEMALLLMTFWETNHTVSMLTIILAISFMLIFL